MARQPVRHRAGPTRPPAGPTARLRPWTAAQALGRRSLARDLDTPLGGGRQPSLSGEQMQKLYRIIAEKNPLQLSFEFALWTRSMVRKVIIDRFGVTLSESQVGRLLRQMGMSPQRPLHRAYQRDPERVEKWLNEEYPAIRALAREEGAQIFFGDEAGVRSDYHSGTTWAPMGETPVVETTGARFGVNLVSAISSKGQLRFMLVDGKMTAEKFIKFLKRLIDKQDKPVFLIVDGHPTHKAKAVSKYIEATNGRLRLYHLPPYSPDLNPDELVWNHLKNHKI
ncbi:IS630 family transposase, partial [candidate division KSB1 bacterium]|nr:IS630 family transposase [candidate division KSB1 bacterium]